MKTKITLVTWLLISCVMIFILPANAQFTHFPTNGAPYHTFFTQNPVLTAVSHGNLDDLDQRTSPIWFKVNGNIVGPQPHNKMHPYVTAGSQVQVNFNVNRNVANRYTMVTYRVQDDGERILYDYHSDHFNLSPPSPPVQGNSNQQLVLVPTCRFEIYFIKGALSTGWNGPAPVVGVVYDPTTDAANPYTNDLENVIAPGKDNRILDFAYGGPNNQCDDCPATLVPSGPNTLQCVYPRLLEVIDLPGTQEKEFIFSVVNTINSEFNNCGSGWPEIGDIMFTNIFPSQTGNNQPYQFRWNYQLGPQIPMYPTAKKGVPLSAMSNVYNLAPGYERAFVFDQRNNHNNWDFNIYQSDIVRFKVSYAEYDRLNTTNNTPTPQICIELSPKHPEPHTSLEPIHCFNLVFNCGFEEPCTEAIDGDITAQIPVEFFNDEFNNLDIPVRLINNSTSPITSITATLGTAPNQIAFSIPTPPTYTNEFSWTVVNNGTSGVVLTGVNTGTYADGAAANFTFRVNASDFLNTDGLLTLTVNTTTGSEEVVLEVANCAIIEPLPVELVSFTGALAPQGIDLKWHTASEKNNDRFEIERSLDGKNFEKIGTQQGKGTTSSDTDYKFLDKQPNKGLNYYRLKQVDYDGTSAYSNIVKVNSERGALSLGVKLIPNPCSNENCSVLLQGVDTSKDLVVEMKDLTGRTVLRQTLPADQQSFNLPKANIGKGVYILTAKNGQYFTHQKVIIQ